MNLYLFYTHLVNTLIIAEVPDHREEDFVIESQELELQITQLNRYFFRFLFFEQSLLIEEFW